ncbi:MAG: DUF2264 domain-containing protein [Pyrinomonadaceae bacterium]
MERRNFLKWASLFGLTGMVKGADVPRFESEALVPAAKNDREYWSGLLDRIATPVLANMSKGELVKNMEMQVGPTWDNRDKRVGYMEAFGRLIAGLAPFISLPDDNTAESKVRKRLREQTVQSLAHAFDPKSPDYLYWGTPQSRQPLVDAAYIAQALITAPDALWKPLSDTTKAQIIHEFETIRQIKPFDNNWVLFAAMIETFLLSIDVKVNAERIDSAIDRVTKWYVGDGWYSDGERFHFDHYNGYVIHPMLTEILRVNVAKGRRDKKEFDTAYKRMQRYASFQERYISPEGTYPVVGRSSTYRAGAFWPLVKLVNDGKLPETIKPAQVRCALTAVLKNTFVPTTFTKGGWLQLGLVGDAQQNITDSYSNTGSMYITSLVFLPLGLPASHEFWSGPFTDWTQRKAWSGKQFPKDYAVDY